MTTPKNEPQLERHEAAGDDYITIIAPSVAAAMRQFRERGLDKLGYAIAGKVVRHRISVAGMGDAEDLFDGQPMISATWFRTN